MMYLYRIIMVTVKKKRCISKGYNFTKQKFVKYQLTYIFKQDVQSYALYTFLGCICYYLIMSKLNTINKKKFFEYSGDSASDRDAMIKLFIDQAVIYTAELESSLHSASNDLWHDIAHKYKGMASFAGAEALYAVCSMAQESASSSKKDKQAIFNLIEQETDKAIQEFATLL